MSAARTKDAAPKLPPGPPPGRPLIGVNTDYVSPKTGPTYTRLNTGYIDAILAAGGLPTLLPPVRRENIADFALLARIFERKTPVLGIGVGMQQLNVFAGGTLHLHLPVDNPKAMPHFDQTGSPHRHMVLIEEGTRLDDIYGTPELRVNSTHHQAVNQIGKRMRVAAKAPDGVIEAIESTDPNWFCVGVQWHPEADTASALDVQIFGCFVLAAARAAS